MTVAVGFIGICGVGGIDALKKVKLWTAAWGGDLLEVLSIVWHRSHYGCICYHRKCIVPLLSKGRTMATVRG